MRVNELIDILRDQPPDAEVELALVAPVDDDADDITVDRYLIDGVLPWVDGDDDTPGEGAGADDIDADDRSEVTVWLVGGEERDVDAFLDAVEQTVETNDS